MSASLAMEPQPTAALARPLAKLAAWYAQRPDLAQVLTIAAASVADSDLPVCFAHARRPVLVKGYLDGTKLAGATFADIDRRAGRFVLDPADRPGLVGRIYQDGDEDGARMSLGAYVAHVLTGAADDSELYRRYRSIRVSPAFARALGLVRPRFLPDETVNPPCIWIGSQDSVTGLHTDPLDNFVLAAIGTKRFHVFAPSDLPALYMRAVENTLLLRSPFDPRAPDFEAFPLATSSRAITFDFEAGDLLFLPFGWPHFVECRSAAFTYNYWLAPRQTPFFLRGGDDR